MQFVCETCGQTSDDLDRVLDGTCECGGSHFKLVSEKPFTLPTAMTVREEIRRDLHRWLDLNIDSLDSDNIGDIRVTFEVPKEKQS
ncbi:MAG: hypothetical protein ACFFEF_16275 [Candidatus Thorarchaeota archaeon]